MNFIEYLVETWQIALFSSISTHCELSKFFFCLSNSWAHPKILFWSEFMYYLTLKVISQVIFYTFYFLKFECRNSYVPTMVKLQKVHAKNKRNLTPFHYVHKQRIPWMLFGIQNMFSTKICLTFFLSLSPCLVIQRKVCDLALIYVLRKKFTSNNEGQKFWLVSPHS